MVRRLVISRRYTWCDTYSSTSSLVSWWENTRMHDRPWRCSWHEITASLDWIQLAGVMSPNDHHNIHYFWFISEFAICFKVQVINLKYFSAAWKRKKARIKSLFSPVAPAHIVNKLNGGGERLEGGLWYFMRHDITVLSRRNEHGAVRVVEFLKILLPYCK